MLTSFSHLKIAIKSWFSGACRPFWQVVVYLYGLSHTCAWCDAGYRQCFSLFTGYVDSGMCTNYFMEVFVLFYNDSWTKLMIMCGCTESLAAVRWLFCGLSRFADRRCAAVRPLVHTPTPTPMINGAITHPSYNAVYHVWLPMTAL